jgi:hypothetical protein
MFSLTAAPLRTTLPASSPPRTRAPTVPGKSSRIWSSSPPIVHGIAPLNALPGMFHTDCMR